jgi:hypothetical protein
VSAISWALLGLATGWVVELVHHDELTRRRRVCVFALPAGGRVSAACWARRSGWAIRRKRRRFTPQKDLKRTSCGEFARKFKIPAPEIGQESAHVQGLLEMARPGIEPGTPRFSGSRKRGAAAPETA